MSNEKRVPDSKEGLALSALESDILIAIDHVGWYAYLWFPVVQREVMNLGSDEPDEKVHAAFASLIRKGALLRMQEKEDDFPQWSPAPGALDIARESLSTERDLRTRDRLGDKR